MKDERKELFIMEDNVYARSILFHFPGIISYADYSIVDLEFLS